MSTRALKLTSPAMRGNDVERFQRDVNAELDRWGISYRLDVDGVYGPETRDVAKSVSYGLGLASPVMDHGATPAIRLKIRNRKLSKAELARYDDRKDWRKRLGKRLEGPDEAIKDGLEWLSRQVGMTESPAGSNRGPKIDQWERACGVFAAPWCGCLANAFLEECGFAAQEWLRFCPWIEQRAKAGEGGWSWHTSDPHPGDLVLYGSGVAEHVGVVENASGGRDTSTIEGNTSSGPGGSQSNGGGVFRRHRHTDGSLSGFPIRGYARPPWKKLA